MLQKTNLYSLYIIRNTKNDDLINSYLEFHDIKIKVKEYQDFIEFTDEIFATKNATWRAFEYYSFGFTIPQIGKEFDILRFGKKSILNIELKHEASTEKIKEQLCKNKYYLNFLHLELHMFTFVSSTKKFYSLDQSDTLIEVNSETVVEIMNKQEIDIDIDLSRIFIPSDFLVSPFNSTSKFLKNEYFLTREQDEIKRDVLKNLKNESQRYFVVKGEAGSGKTLLIYDLARVIMENANCCLVHCGNLNEGQNSLNEEHSWDILPIKSFSVEKLTDIDVLIIDESQRIRKAQLIGMLEYAKLNSLKIIFSYDEKQVLNATEKNANIPQLIQENIKPITYNLKGKVRTNKELTAFIKSLFDSKRIIEKYRYNLIELIYLSTKDEAQAFLKSNLTSTWTVINYTPSLYENHAYEKYYVQESVIKTHSVIGQEFDNVLVIIDEDFTYVNNKLSYVRNCYYNPVYMLYQNITRARNKIKLVIIGNQNVLQRALQILNAQNS